MMQARDDETDLMFIVQHSNIFGKKNEPLTQLINERQHLKTLALGMHKLIANRRFDEKYFRILINYAEDADHLAEAINYLSDADLIPANDDTNLNLLLENSWRAKNIVDVMQFLNIAQILKAENYPKLFVDFEVQANVYGGIAVLSDGGLLTTEYYSLIIQHAQFAYRLALGLVCLHQAKLLTTERRDALIAAGKDAHSLAEGFFTLHAGGLDTLLNTSELLAAPKNAAALAEGMVYLHRKELLQVPAYRAALIKCSSNANHFAKMIDILNQQKLLDADNIALLLTDKNHYPTVAKAAEKLIAAEFFNQISFTVLMKNTEMAAWIADGIIYLKIAKLAMKENCLALGVEQAESVMALVTVIATLAKAQMLDEPNYTALIQNVAHAQQLGSAIVFFHPLTKDAYASLLANPQDAINTAKRSVGLPTFANARTNLLAAPPPVPRRVSLRDLQSAKAAARKP